MSKYNLLQELLQNNLEDIPQARLHSIDTLNTSTAACFVLRDDELGFGISGSKRRKYASLLPYIKRNQFEKVILIGSAFSNHIVSFAQCLIENRYEPVLFLLKRHDIQIKGNQLLIKLLVSDDQVYWIPEQEWPHVEEIAEEWAKSQPYKCLVVPEGGCMAEALFGSLTLSLDILRHKPQYSFNHIILEAGTGLTAIALILAFAWIDEDTIIHVLLLGGSSEAFLQKLLFFLEIFNKTFSVSLTLEQVQPYFQLHIPETARSFGSVNAHVLKMIRYMARNEGILTDPIYSAKLFLEGRGIINNLQGNVLFVHGGGGLSLMGFQELVATFLSREN